MPAFDPNIVYLFDGAKYIPLDKNPAVMVPRPVFVTVLLIVKMPGSSADVRVKTGTHPFLLVGNAKGGQVVRLSVERAKNDPHRETRLVSEGQFTPSDLTHFSDEKLSNGWHKITPSINRPGEFAWFPFIGGAGIGGYDFAVDP